MIYELPNSIEINGVEFPVRSDYRAVLDICTALSDIELSNEEKAIVALEIFYPGFGEMDKSDYKEALEKCFWFINGGKNEEGSKKRNRQIVNWEKDFPIIVSPINRVLGKEIRAEKFLHWWTFISAYYEIGDCLFAQVIRIREKKAKGKQLDKSEREFYAQNRELVDIKTRYTESEKNMLSMWGVK